MIGAQEYKEGKMNICAFYFFDKVWSFIAHI